MTQKTEEYRRRRQDEDAGEDLQEQAGWKTRDPVAHRFLENLENSSPGLADELRNAARGNLDHRGASWNTQEHNALRYTEEDESRYTYDLDPSSSAGKIFLSFEKAVIGAGGSERWETANRIAENLLEPVRQGMTKLEHLTGRGENHAVPTVAGTMDNRIRGVRFLTALVEGMDDDFASNMDNIQGMSRDLEHLESRGVEANGFTASLQADHPRLAAELDSDWDARPSRNSASWLKPSGEGDAGQTIYQAFQDDRRYKSGEYRHLTAENLGVALARPVAAGAGEFRSIESPAEEHPEARILDPRGYDRIMGHMADYLEERVQAGMIQATDGALHE